MSSPRTYVKRLLIGSLFAVIFMLLAPPVLLALLFIVPHPISGDFTVFLWRISEETELQLRAALLGGTMIVALLGFFLWMAKGVIKDSAPHQRRRYLSATVIYTSLLCYGFAIGGMRLAGPQYGRCEFYNSPTTLDAGRKVFNGVTYDIQVCGSAPRPQDGDNDRLQVTVRDERGEMLARRHYSVNWEAGTSFHEPLQYDKDAIVISNAFGEDIRIAIPPSRFDWIQARVPLLD